MVEGLGMEFGLFPESSGKTLNGFKRGGGGGRGGVGGGGGGWGVGRIKFMLWL